MAGAPLLIDRIIGQAQEPALQDALHQLGHDGGRIETIVVATADLPRRRFHAETDHGTACFIALPRDVSLADGAVLLLDPARAIILRVGEQSWLTLRPEADAALELGYRAGNLHWRVRFAEGCLLVALDGPRETYLARLHDLVEQGKLQVLA